MLIVTFASLLILAWKATARASAPTRSKPSPLAHPFVVVWELKYESHALRLPARALTPSFRVASRHYIYATYFATSLLHPPETSPSLIPFRPSL